MNTMNAWGGAQTQHFYALTPERVLQAVEESGVRCTGRAMALNSYENRVYEVELDWESLPEPLASKAQKDARLRNRVAKFYRPGRWSKDQILEEHQFLLDLKDAEIPAIAPLLFENGETLRECSQTGIFYALFPKVGGRSPDELSEDELERVGRLIARIHTVGERREAKHRIILNTETYGMDHLEFLLKGDWISADYRVHFEEAVRGICEKSATWFHLIGKNALAKIHGDCHRGNLLWNNEGPFFLDFDDMVRGPRVQDLWLLIPERGEEARGPLSVMLKGYEQLRDFDRRELKLIEPLRALRWVHFAAWIARRWEDPSFPKAFPQFGTDRYWAELVSDLSEQNALIEEISHYSP